MILLSADGINKIENEAADVILKGKQLNLLAKWSNLREKVFKATLLLRVEIVFVFLGFVYGLVILIRALVYTAMPWKKRSLTTTTLSFLRWSVRINQSPSTAIRGTESCIRNEIGSSFTFHLINS